MSRIFTAVLLFVLGASATAAEPAKFITECFDCHGPSGVSADKNMPTIAGMSSAYMEDTLFAYVDGARPAKSVKPLSGDKPATDMVTLSKALSEDQIKKIAEYFAGQKFVAAKQPFDEKLAHAGKLIHKMQCARCHEAAGSVPDDDAGLLAGQWTGYLQQAFEEYRKEQRQGDKKMLSAISKLTDEEIKALLNYYATNKP